MRYIITALATGEELSPAIEANTQEAALGYWAAAFALEHGTRIDEPRRIGPETFTIPDGPAVSVTAVPD